MVNAGIRHLLYHADRGNPPGQGKAADKQVALRSIVPRVQPATEPTAGHARQYARLRETGYFPRFHRMRRYSARIR